MLIALTRPQCAHQIDQVGNRLLWPIVLGSAVGLAFLAPFSLHVYFKHEFPLFVMPLLLAKGVAIAWLLDRAFLKKKFRLWAVAAVALYAVDSAMVHVNNTLTGAHYNLAWVEFIKKNPESDFFLATYQPSRAPQIIDPDQFNISYIDVAKAQELLSRAPSEGKTQFLVYQPNDQTIDFDAPIPRCFWREWISTLLNSPPPYSPSTSCIYGFPLPASARSQSTNDDMAALGQVAERSSRGIGYVILALP